MTIQMLGMSPYAGGEKKVSTEKITGESEGGSVQTKRSRTCKQKNTCSDSGRGSET